jgi:hypothetical protein
VTAGVVGSLDQRVARATALDTARIGLEVLAPMLAQGVIVRRPRMLALAEKLDVDRRAGHPVRLLSGRLDAARPLPRSLNHTTHCAWLSANYGRQPRG